MVNALVRELGEPAAGFAQDPLANAFPTPIAMAGRDERFYREVVRSGYRAPYFVDLAEMVASGQVDLEVLADAPRLDLPDGEVEARLRSLPGIGPYAAANVMMTLGRSSRLILDSWTRPAYVRAAGRRKLPSDAQIQRRFRRYGDVALAGGGSYTVVDDYGHHPAEMAATIAAARGAFPGRRLLLAFQPHRFTRTRDLFEDFVRVLSTVDELVLADVYPAGEAPIVGADGRSLARSVRLAGKVEPLFVETTAEMRDAVLSRVRDGDVVMTMGAGSIANLAPELAIPSVGRRAQ